MRNPGPGRVDRRSHSRNNPWQKQTMAIAKDKRGDVMAGEESVSALRPVVPLPTALYYSNGLLFELYDGGQPWRRRHIVWERLRTIEEQDPANTSVQRSCD